MSSNVAFCEYVNMILNQPKKAKKKKMKMKMERNK